MSEKPPSPKRDRRLDSLRGLLLVMMGVNHITSPLQVVTDHPLGFVSAAEGFVFVSGLTAGLVYMRRWRERGPAPTTIAALRRAGTIYLCHLALYVGILFWTLSFTATVGTAPGNAPEGMLRHPAYSLSSGLLLLYQPPLLDILPMYAIFLLLLPIVLRALSRGMLWQVLIASFAGWAITNLLVPQRPVVTEVVQGAAFNWGAWQLLFVGGLVFGAAWARQERLLPKFRLPLLLLVAAYCTTTFLLRHAYLPSPAGIEPFFNKNNLAIGRLLNVAALFYLVSLAASRWPQAMDWPPLAFLGRHSLPVFCVHVAVAYVLYAFPQYVASTPAQRWLGTAIMLASMAAIAAWHDHRRHRLKLLAGKLATA